MSLMFLLIYVYWRGLDYFSCLSSSLLLCLFILHKKRKESFPFWIIRRSNTLSLHVLMFSFHSCSILITWRIPLLGSIYNWLVLSLWEQQCWDYCLLKHNNGIQHRYIFVGWLFNLWILRKQKVSWMVAMHVATNTFAVSSV